jgi:hypothetical protein
VASSGAKWTMKEIFWPTPIACGPGSAGELKAGEESTSNAAC